MTQSMKELERATEDWYAEVSSLLDEIERTHHEALGLRNLLLIPLIILIPFLVMIFIFASWFAALGPLFTAIAVWSVGIRRLHGLRTKEIPQLTQRYSRTLTLATEALQAQEERKRLRLLNPGEYDRIEHEAEMKIIQAETRKADRQRKVLEQEMWEIAFRRAVDGRNPYSWM